MAAAGPRRVCARSRLHCPLCGKCHSPLARRPIPPTIATRGGSRRTAPEGILTKSSEGCSRRRTLWLRHWKTQCRALPRGRRPGSAWSGLRSRFSVTLAGISIFAGLKQEALGDHQRAAWRRYEQGEPIVDYLDPSDDGLRGERRRTADLLSAGQRELSDWERRHLRRICRHRRRPAHQRGRWTAASSLRCRLEFRGS